MAAYKAKTTRTHTEAIDDHIRLFLSSQEAYPHSTCLLSLIPVCVNRYRKVELCP